MTGDRTPDKRAVMEYLEQFDLPHSSLGYSYLVEAIILVCGLSVRPAVRRTGSLSFILPIAFSMDSRTVTAKYLCGLSGFKYRSPKTVRLPMGAGMRPAAWRNSFLCDGIAITISPQQDIFIRYLCWEPREAEKKEAESS